MPMLIAATLLLFSFSASASASASAAATEHPSLDIATPRSDEQVKGLYEQWLARHGKTYNGIGEKDRRFEIFKDNLNFIDQHNMGNRTYKLGLNRFADLTHDEYKSMFLGTRIDAKRRFVKSKAASQRYVARPGDRLPVAVDWRKKGAVAPVKNQGTCGKFCFCFFFWLLVCYE